jgi:hypothetical protein
VALTDASSTSPFNVSLRRLYSPPDAGLPRGTGANSPRPSGQSTQVGCCRANERHCSSSNASVSDGVPQGSHAPARPFYLYHEVLRHFAIERRVDSSRHTSVLTSLALPDSAVSATDLNRLTASPHSTALWLWLRSLSRSITVAWERRGRGRGRAKDGTLPPPPFVLAPKPPRRSWHEDVPRRFYSRSSQWSTRNLCIRRGMGKQSKPLIYFHLFP